MVTPESEHKSDSPLFLIEGESLEMKDIVELYSPLVYKTCLSMLKKREEADDCAQEVWIKVFTKSAQFKKNSLNQLGSWICSIAHTCALMRIRHVKRKPGREVLRFHHESCPQFPADIAVSSPSLQYEALETNKKLRAVYELMTPREQAVVSHILEGSSIDEMMDVFGTTRTSVKTWRNRARNLLRTALS